MPRSGAGVYSKPAGTTAVSGTTIESSKYNQTVDDLVNDANLARPVVAGGTGGTTAASARTNLGLEIGADVQAYSPNLTSMAAIGAVADRIQYTTGPATWAGTPLTAFMRTLLDDADAATARATLGASQTPLDEDDFASNSAARPPSQQSAKAYVDGVISGLPFTKQFKSGNQVITSGTGVNLSHGLSATPKLVQLRLQFVNAVHGYGVGSEIVIEDHRNADDFSNRGVSVQLSPTSVIVRFGTEANVFKILNTSGVRVDVSNSDVRLIVYAWA